MSKIDTNVLKDGQLAVATAPQNGTIISDASAVDATALVQTDNGPQLCVKTVEVGEGGGGGGGTVDQTYDPTSTNAQSGTAVAEAVAPALKNTATGANSMTIGGLSTDRNSSVNIGVDSQAQSNVSVAIGYKALSGSAFCVAIGSSGGSTSQTSATGLYCIAIGYNAKATAESAIQLGTGTNSTANTLQVFTFKLLDKTTGLIPADRIGTGYDATKTQVLKNVNGTLTWVDE